MPFMKVNATYDVLMHWVGARKKTQTSQFSVTQTFSPNSSCGRNLRKNQLGGIIFGCKNATMKECLSKQLFVVPIGSLYSVTWKQLYLLRNSVLKFCLPAHHFCYVKNIDPGLPLFLFNYTDRKLHGIFEAASSGRMFIDPYGWTTDGSERTQYPAQVQICVRLKCHPLPEDKFKEVIADNYYTHNRFYFELDHAQTSKLISLLSAGAIASDNSAPQNTQKWITVSRPLASNETLREGETSKMLELETEHSTHSSTRSYWIENDFSFDGYIRPLDTNEVEKEVNEDEQNSIFMKLKELTLDSESQDLSLANNANDTPGMNNTEEGYMEALDGLDEKEQTSNPPFDYQYNIAQCILVGARGQRIDKFPENTNGEELLPGAEAVPSIGIKAFHHVLQLQTSGASGDTVIAVFYLPSCFLHAIQIEAEMEIQHLKDRCTLLESACNIPNHLAHVEKVAVKSTAELHLDPKDSLFLIGGFDGNSWLATMDLYCTSQNVIKSLKPMSSVRSYASVVWLNGEIYVFGGGNGYVWYDTVESYNPVHDNWTLCPSLNQKKGSLSGAALNDKIFAVGGGNGVDCFSDVEMLDLDIGRWIPTRSMLEKRFALSAVELNGAIYAIGGFDGNDYLRSAERFDPREHSWTKIPNMNVKRGCHSLVVLNEKLYALGGFDGDKMVPSIEVFDPRLGAWTMGEPMNHCRGYSAAVVVKESIYMIGGVKVGENIVDTVENYKEGQGWQETCTTAAVKRCFLSAIACSHE
ncbi:Kelch-like protein 1 [Glycine soja]|nr:Kelch-like protein 1 [Glycine soja]